MSAGKNTPRASRVVLSLAISKSPSGVRCGDATLTATSSLADPGAVLSDSATWHRLRDAYHEHFASLAGKNEHGLEAVARVMGHVDSDLIRQRYARRVNESKCEENPSSDEYEH